MLIRTTRVFQNIKEIIYLRKSYSIMTKVQHKININNAFYFSISVLSPLFLHSFATFASWNFGQFFLICRHSKDFPNPFIYSLVCTFLHFWQPGLGILISFPLIIRILLVVALFGFGICTLTLVLLLLIVSPILVSQHFLKNKTNRNCLCQGSKFVSCYLLLQCQS